ncbi:MAG: MiaB/RimO family radical SAM methylthiotransferase [Candidatus Omnitrophica bacterium]|nr:MiaB/RimO family radical SAM methylthiotransferase [Candidatus Omnitrophota bacterium]
MKTVKFYTLGCKVNQYDTQSIRERFLQCGFVEVNNGKPADVYVINTCTVTQAADSKSREIIRRSCRENPKARLIVTGCLAENPNDSLKAMSGVDYIIGKRFFPVGISSFFKHTRAFLKIQDGCDNFCSYCKVPLVRGRSRSRPLEEIIHEANQLAINGHKEIVLTGICLGAYGKDLLPKTSLVRVIKELEKIERVLRIRLSSIEAKDITAALISHMKSSNKLCPHLHIPIQSGDDTILKKMRRKYTRDDYLKLVVKIKKQIPGIAITTDCLVGFPGETERQFQNTADLLNKVLPLRTHIFPYSRREGTAAASDPGIVSSHAVKERAESLKKTASFCAASYKKKFISKSADVLFEGRSKLRPDCWEGYTGNYIPVLLRSKLDLKNKLLRVKLKKIEGEFILVGLQ